ncbi:MAG TPA: amidohydrolase family protein [Kofleriaceae bacterium]|nr:amidohydrolase family protein [Kofleriaceae bacterium]
MRAALAAAVVCAAVGCGRCGSDQPGGEARGPDDRGGAGARAPAPDSRRVIDFHTHIDPSTIADAVALFDRHGIAVAVNLSGGAPGAGLEQQLAAAARFPGRVVVFTTPRWSLARTGPGYGARMADDLEAAHRLGARGLKITKGLGLAYTDATGALIAVDSPELDPLFERAGQLGMPVAIHTGDPIAFWRPVDRDNERYAELSAHPRWALYGRPVPSWDELQAALERRIARHPRTAFVSVHFGNAPEHPERVGALLDRYPNLFIDTAARIPEIGRHPPSELRALFLRHPDRILFGTDLGIGPGHLVLGSSGPEPPTDADVERFFGATWRYFETADRDFPHPTPIQGAWTVSGLDLPDASLDALYRQNAAHLLQIRLP